MTHTLAVPLLARVTGLCCRTEGKVPGQGGQTQGHAEPPEQSVQLHPPPPPPHGSAGGCRGRRPWGQVPEPGLPERGVGSAPLGEGSDQRPRSQGLRLTSHSGGLSGTGGVATVWNPRDPSSLHPSIQGFTPWFVLPRTHPCTYPATHLPPTLPTLLLTWLPQKHAPPKYSPTLLPPPPPPLSRESHHFSCPRDPLPHLP